MPGRVLTFVAVVLLALSIAPATMASTELLSGERLIITNSAGSSEGSYEGILSGDFDCAAGTLSVTGAGNAYGPFPGTFDADYELAFAADGELTRFDVDFHISGATEITGSAFLAVAPTYVTCDSFVDDDDGRTIHRFQVTTTLFYSATIAGSSEPDQGMVAARLTFYCGDAPNVTFTGCDPATASLNFGSPPPPPPASDPPVIEAVSFSTTSLENGPAPVTMTVTTTITDDVGVLAGGCVEVPPEDGGGMECSGSEITFRPPRGDAYAIGWLAHVSGDVYEAEVTFPTYAVLGTWSATVAAVDSDYNYTVLTPDELAALEWPSGVDITGTDDTTPPLLVDLHGFGTTLVNIGAEDPLERRISYALEASDDLSGIYTVLLTLLSEAGDTYQLGFDPLGDGHYSGFAEFDGDWLIGRWSVQDVVLEDWAGNRAYVPISDASLSFEAVKSMTSTVPPGGTFSSADDGNNSLPLFTEITSPAGGEITIVASSNDSAPAGYTLFGYQFAITAPPGTAAEPLMIRFVLSQWLIPPDINPATVTILRNDVAVPNCTGTAGTASPDPCVSDRTTTAEGDLSITVLTSHASDWAVGIRDSVPSAMSAKQDAVAALEATEGATGKAAKLVQQALSYLRTSLTSSWWLDADHLDPKLGAKVLDQDFAAVKLLMSKDLAGVAGLTGVMQLVADADRTLAQTAIDDAINAGGRQKEIQAAQAALAKGDAAAGIGRYDLAIEAYKTAWTKAIAARS